MLIRKLKGLTVMQMNCEAREKEFFQDRKTLAQRAAAWHVA